MGDARADGADRSRDTALTATRLGSLTAPSAHATLVPVRRIVLGAVFAAAVAGLTGCSGACADSMPYPPALTVDTTVWSAGHPDSSVRVCLESACETETASELVGGARKLSVPQGRTPLGEHARVDVTEYRGGVVEAHSSRLLTFTKNPCFAQCGACTPMGRSAAVLLSADGAIQQR